MSESKRNSLPGKYEGFTEKKYAGFTVKSQYVAGFDGTKLALDLVFPTCEDGSVAEGKFPVILFISRGGRMKKSPKRNGVDLIKRCVPYGYVGAVLENRGAGASYGTQDSFASIENRKDVNAVIDWMIKQDWSDGQVATVGGSNRGLIQFAAAVSRPEPSKGLKGITPIVCDPDFYYQDYPNGVSAIPMHRKANVSGSAISPKKKTKEEVLADPQVEPVDEDVNGDMAYEAYLTGQYGKNKRFMESLLLENMCRDDGNPNFGGEKTNLTIPPSRTSTCLSRRTSGCTSSPASASPALSASSWHPRSGAAPWCWAPGPTGSAPAPPRTWPTRKGSLTCWRSTTSGWTTC